MKRILFIDDERDPMGALRTRLGIDADDDVVWHKRWQPVIPLVQWTTVQQWDEIWFDHDLGGNDTTMPIVTAMCEMVFHKLYDPTNGPMCVLHTSNPVGRSAMHMTLKRWNWPVTHVYL